MNEVKAFYAVNLSIAKMEPEELLSSVETVVKLDLPCKTAFLHLNAIGAVYGPFETAKKASMMAASELDESRADFFGVRWAFIEVPMIELVFHSPLIDRSRKFVCSERCGGVQLFKGACSKCKAEGKPLVPTIEVRDWEGRL